MRVAWIALTSLLLATGCTHNMTPADMQFVVSETSRALRDASDDTSNQLTALTTDILTPNHTAILDGQKALGGQVNEQLQIIAPEKASELEQVATVFVQAIGTLQQSMADNQEAFVTKMAEWISPRELYDKLEDKAAEGREGGMSLEWSEGLLALLLGASPPAYMAYRAGRKNDDLRFELAKAAPAGAVLPGNGAGPTA